MKKMTKMRIRLKDKRGIIVINRTFIEDKIFALYSLVENDEDVRFYRYFDEYYQSNSVHPFEDELLNSLREANLPLIYSIHDMNQEFQTAEDYLNFIDSWYENEVNDIIDMFDNFTIVDENYHFNKINEWCKEEEYELLNTDDCDPNEYGECVNIIAKETYDDRFLYFVEINQETYFTNQQNVYGFLNYINTISSYIDPVNIKNYFGVEIV